MVSRRRWGGSCVAYGKALHRSSSDVRRSRGAGIGGWRQVAYTEAGSLRLGNEASSHNTGRMFGLELGVFALNGRTRPAAAPATPPLHDAKHGLQTIIGKETARDRPVLAARTESFLPLQINDALMCSVSRYSLGTRRQ